MRVDQLWRYPLKSAGGEQLAALELGAHGPVADRRWALVQVADGTLVTARRDPVLLSVRATEAGGVLRLRLPDGSAASTADGPDEPDRALTRLLGRPVRLVDSAADGAVPGLPDDPADARVSLVSTGTLGIWDPRRFRSNVLLGGSGEDGLVGRGARVGSARLALRGPITRCVMVTREQPGLTRDPGVLRAVHADRDGMLGVAAVVTVPGLVRVGDELVAARPG